MWCEGGVPADLGVIRTELLGDRFAGAETKFGGIILCMEGRAAAPGWPCIAILTALPFISSPMASWLAFCARLHFALLFWNQTCGERERREKHNHCISDIVTGNGATLRNVALKKLAARFPSRRASPSKKHKQTK